MTTLETLELTTNFLLGAVILRVVVFIFSMFPTDNKTEQVKLKEGELNLPKRKERTDDSDFGVVKALVGLGVLTFIIIKIFS
jgi:hypothetical protein